VHSVAGVSRSVTLCVAYLVKHNNMTANEAVEHIKTKRKCANPNSAFVSQLQYWKRECRKEEEEL
jgi:protein-tyrosine phosphatase